MSFHFFLFFSLLLNNFLLAKNNLGKSQLVGEKESSVYVYWNNVFHPVSASAVLRNISLFENWSLYNRQFENNEN